MTTVEGAARARKLLLLVVVSLVALAADQLTKYWAVSKLTIALNGRTGLVDRVHGFFVEKNLDNDPNDVPGRPLRTLRERVVIPNYWNHRYVENPGAAWGLFATLPDKVREPFFVVITVVSLLFIALLYARLGPQQRFMQWALALVMGGALGNFVDRVARGYVIDFIDWHWRNQPGLRWPTFNIADAAITIGVAMMIVDSCMAWLRARREARPEPNAVLESAAAEAASPPPRLPEP